MAKSDERKWSVTDTDHHGLVGIGFRPSHGGRAAILLPPDEAEQMANEIAAVVKGCRENDAKHAALGTTPLRVSSAKALIDRSVLVEALEQIEATWECPEAMRCATCLADHRNARTGMRDPHAPDCRYERVAGAIRRALGR